mgnify:CR=1 FL=1
MSQPDSASASASFLIKLWIDGSADDGDRTLTWRGQIQHVQTGERRTFSGPFQMLAFMDRYLIPRGKAAE